MRKWTVAALLAGAAVAGAPAFADVKAGVDAWQRGEYAKAIAEWRGPAVAGDPDAQFNLGQAYRLGRGVPADTGMAEEWFRKAALQGHPQAEVNYGLTLFENGKRMQAVPWLEKGAARGDPRAQYVLGVQLYNGDGVAKDWVRAYALIARATAKGLPQAGKAQAQMDGFISLPDRQKALELARQYERDEGRPQVASAPPPVKSGPTRPIGRTELPPSTAYQAPQTAPDTPPAQVAEAQPMPPIVRPAPKRPAPQPAAPPPAAAEPTAVRDGGWKVQLGAFGEPGNAQKLWGQVAGRFPGRRVFYVKSGRLTKVLVGPFASSAEAGSACGSLRPCVPVRE
ncbi:SPOR domain-containing protein [Sphingomonas sp.]|uniref:SPOR domain-containing protein n=1 Tax=Sphingomonas sp. TaxID=28214 RepID=UPI001EBE1378|nr:SPOR domain-containing protein [Sphingomonas sp.]MBX3595194.1 SEL1-like repeat protein [Sphingomonas sp.]